MKPEHYQLLAEAKLTVEQIGVVMKILAESEAAMKAAEEARKSVARDRVQRWRDKQKSDETLQKRNGNATVRLTRVEDSSSKKDISREDKKDISHEFESEIWPAYPKKAGKGAALKAYIAARKRASFEAILAGVRRYASEREGQDPQFTKHAQGWFNGDHWSDEPQPHFRPQPTAPPPGQDFNAILDQIQGKPNAAHQGPIIDGSHERADRGGAPGVVQLYALPARR